MSMFLYFCYSNGRLIIIALQLYLMKLGISIKNHLIKQATCFYKLGNVETMQRRQLRPRSLTWFESEIVQVKHRK